MKRSEMLELIKFQLGFYKEHDMGSLDNEAFDLLGCIEKAGMQPPIFIARVATGKKYNPETDFAADTYVARGWERE